MKISKPTKTDRLIFEDLQVGDVFSCQGSEGLSNPDIMMKVNSLPLRSEFIAMAVSLESAKVYGNFKGDMPVRYFPEATVVLGKEA